jgi:hypothetical protein
VLAIFCALVVGKPAGMVLSCLLSSESFSSAEEGGPRMSALHEVFQ